MAHAGLLGGGFSSEHDRSEIVRRLGLVLKSSGPETPLAFDDLQIFSRQIIPFTPARVKESALSGEFSELNGLSKELLSTNGWSAESYLELISSSDARDWWSGCIGMRHCETCSLQLRGLGAGIMMLCASTVRVRGQVRNGCTGKACCMRSEPGCTAARLTFIKMPQVTLLAKPRTT